MLLRASGEFDVGEAVAGGGGGVAAGAELGRFVEAALTGTDDELAAARAALAAQVGEAGVVDAAAVMSTFQKMDRFADATGIPLDPPVEMATRDLRGAMGVDGFATAGNTPAPGRLQALAGRLAGRGMRRLLPLVGAVTRRLGRSRGA